MDPEQDRVQETAQVQEDVPNLEKSHVLDLHLHSDRTKVVLLPVLVQRRGRGLVLDPKPVRLQVLVLVPENRDPDLKVCLKGPVVVQEKDQPVDQDK